MWINHPNGMSTRPVFFHGKRWQVSRVTCDTRPRPCFVAVFATRGQCWPRVFGPTSPQARIARGEF